MEYFDTEINEKLLLNLSRAFSLILRHIGVICKEVYIFFSLTIDRAVRLKVEIKSTVTAYDAISDFAFREYNSIAINTNVGCVSKFLYVRYSLIFRRFVVTFRLSRETYLDGFREKGVFNFYGPISRKNFVSLWNQFGRLYRPFVQSRPCSVVLLLRLRIVAPYLRRLLRRVPCSKIHDNIAVYYVHSIGTDDDGHIPVSSETICFSPRDDGRRLYTRVSFFIFTICHIYGENVF